MNKLKETLLLIDEKHFGSRFYNIYRNPIFLSSTRNRFKHSIHLYYQKKNSELNRLSDLYGSDKGECDSRNNPYPWPSHNYADYYCSLFRLAKDDVKILVECGLGTNNPNVKSSMGINGKPGASLRMWRDFFPNARIIGCDIDEDVLFSEERISTFKCDQTSNLSIDNFCNSANLLMNSIDIIIDDGLHEFNAGKVFFERMINFLKPNGVYIIEDVSHKDMAKYQEYFSKGDMPYEVKFVYHKSPLRIYGDDNNLIEIWKLI